jgi:hypothetical protein
MEIPMAGWIKKARDMVSPQHVEKAADAVEDNLTDARVDSVLNKVPGGKSLADKVPDDLNTKAADALRDNLGEKKPQA